jgi:nitroreductase
MSDPRSPVAKSVTAAVLSRRSVRAFLPDPLPVELMTEILDLARHSPSGSNMQPWFVDVVTGSALEGLKAAVREKIPLHPKGEGAPFEIYPKEMTEAYVSRRNERGEVMYEVLGIGREDKFGRLLQFARNYELFGAPCGLFFSIDRFWDKPQWAHLGMFMQTVMLLAEERGLGVCAQESWGGFHPTVTSFLRLPPERMFYCGMAIGYPDRGAPVNSLSQSRIELDAFVTWHTS